MKKIILDTNFLTLPHQFNVDIFEEINRIMEEEYELITLSSVIEELKKISESRGNDAVAAKIALELVEKKNVKVINTNNKNVDNAIVAIADKNTIIATNDKALKKKIKNKNVKVIYLRGKKHLDMG
jgi:rRNA-processing protein FCF1